MSGHKVAKGAPDDRGRRRGLTLSVALQPRLQSHRECLRQAQGSPTQSCRTLRRRPLAPIGRIIDCFAQTECKNYFTAAGRAAPRYVISRGFAETLCDRSGDCNREGVRLARTKSDVAKQMQEMIFERRSSPSACLRAARCWRSATLRVVPRGSTKMHTAKLRKRGRCGAPTSRRATFVSRCWKLGRSPARVVARQLHWSQTISPAVEWMSRCVCCGRPVPSTRAAAVITE